MINIFKFFKRLPSISCIDYTEGDYVTREDGRIGKVVKIKGDEVFVSFYSGESRDYKLNEVWKYNESMKFGLGKFVQFSHTNFTPIGRICSFPGPGLCEVYWNVGKYEVVDQEKLEVMS